MPLIRGRKIGNVNVGIPERPDFLAYSGIDPPDRVCLRRSFADRFQNEALRKQRGERQL